MHIVQVHEQNNVMVLPNILTKFLLPSFVLKGCMLVHSQGAVAHEQKNVTLLVAICSSEISSINYLSPFFHQGRYTACPDQ